MQQLESLPLPAQDAGPLTPSPALGAVGLAIGLVGLFALTLFAIGDLKLVSDDFYLLVNDLQLPLWKSHDELHRPLRNALFKLLGRQVGVQQVLPYRILVAASYAAALGLLFQLMRRLGARPAGAAAAVGVLAFFPRNHEVLFWFAAWQDIAAGIGVLLTCLLFLEFRRSGSTRKLAFAALTYGVALGLKETAIVIPALVLLVDLHAERSIAPVKTLAFWRGYLPLAFVSLAFVGYFLSNAGMVQLTGHKAAGYYGYGGVLPAAASEVRALLNVALPFSTTVGFKTIRPLQVAALLVESGLVLFFVSRLRMWSGFLVAAGWVLCALFPTAAFATILNADRYLFVPAMGAALLVGLLVDASMRARPGIRTGSGLAVALVIYGVAGVAHLAELRSFWKRQGDEAAFVLGEAVRLAPTLEPSSEVAFVNLTAGLANGLDGALRSRGFPASVRLLREVVCAGCPEQERLLAQLRACDASPSVGAVGPRVVLLELGTRLVRLEPGCAFRAIDRDRRQRPYAWQAIPGE